MSHSDLRSHALSGPSGVAIGRDQDCGADLVRLRKSAREKDGKNKKTQRNPRQGKFPSSPYKVFALRRYNNGDYVQLIIVSRELDRKILPVREPKQSLSAAAAGGERSPYQTVTPTPPAEALSKSYSRAEISLGHRTAGCMSKIPLCALFWHQ